MTDIYPAGKANAKTTITTAYVAGIDTTINVQNTANFPAAPNYITIKDNLTPADKYVVIKYTSKTATSFGGLTVMMSVSSSGTAFVAGAIVERDITGIEHDAMLAHVDNTSNPHAVTKTQVGLSNVDNTSDANKPVSTAQAAAIAVVQNDVNTHEAKTNNPHAVTKTQVGLSNVDNTSDANKPVSTAQAAAIAAVQSDADSHASRHSNSGADRITIDASQTTSGTFSIARLPSLLLPEPAFTFARQTNAIQNTIKFTDGSTSSASAPILSRKYDFGDGSTSTEASPTHTYPAFGRYKVTLEVKNKFGTATIAQTVTVAADPIYGMRVIDAETSPAAKIEYTDDAIGKTPVHYDSATSSWSMGDWTNEVDKCFNPCILAYGATSRKYLDKTNLALYKDGTASPFDLVNGNAADGDAMVELAHLTYVQITRDGNDIIYRFCASQPDETYIPKAHQFGNEVRQYAFNGMFEGIVENGVLKSKYAPSTFPTASTKQDVCRSYTTSAKKGSDTFGLKNINTDDLHTLLSMLFLKTTNFQGVVGNGNSSNGVFLKSGEGLSLTGGCLQGSTTATNQCVVLFWVVNKYANYWEDVDGCVKIADGTYWVNRTNKDFLNIESLPVVAPSNYDVVKFTTPESGFAKRMSGDARCPLLPVTTGANSTTDYCDYFYTFAGTKKLLRGGCRSSGAGCGPFYSGVDNAPAYVGSYVVARLQAFLAAE